MKIKCLVFSLNYGADSILVWNLKFFFLFMELTDLFDTANIKKDLL